MKTFAITYERDGMLETIIMKANTVEEAFSFLQMSALGINYIAHKEVR